MLASCRWRILGALLLTPCTNAQLPALLPASGVVAGRCIAADGTPIAGATVVVTLRQSTGYPLPWQFTEIADPEPQVTGADGRFRVALTLPLAPGRSDGHPPHFHLTVSAPGRASRFGDRLLTHFVDTPVLELGDLTLPRGVTPRVRVVDAAGRPVGDVPVFARRVPEGMALHSEPDPFPLLQYVFERTRADGEPVWRHGLQPGLWEVAVWAQDRAVDPKRVRVDLETPIAEAVILAAPAVDVGRGLRGVVVDRTGAPVPGFPLAVRTQGRNEGEDTVRTGADGAFCLPTGSAGPGDQLEVVTPRNDRYDQWGSFGPFMVGRDNLRLVLPTRHAVKLQVVSAADGQTVERLSFRCTPAEVATDAAAMIRWSGTVARGLVELPGLYQGTYTVQVFPHSRSLAASALLTFTVPPAKGDIVRVELPAARALEVQVAAADGRPVPGATVELFWNDGGHNLLASNLHVVAGNEEASEARARFDRPPIRVDRAETDAAGKVRLHGPTSESMAELRVRAAGLLPAVEPLPAWSRCGRAATVRLLPAARVRGRVPAPFGLSGLDPGTAGERAEALIYGRGANEWRRSVEDLLHQRRPCIAVVMAGNAPAWLDRVFVIQEDGSFDLGDLPPGRARLVLVTWQRKGEGFTRQDHPRPLAELTLKAGETQDLRLELPADSTPPGR